MKFSFEIDNLFLRLTTYVENPRYDQTMLNLGILNFSSKRNFNTGIEISFVDTVMDIIKR